MLALLLAKGDVRVTVLEAHGDFERKFRADCETYPDIKPQRANLAGLARRRIIQLDR